MALAGQEVVLVLAGSGIVARTTTDENGNYIFEGLVAGNYRVRFMDDDLGDKEFVDANVGGDDTIDSDVTSVGNGGDGNTNFFTLGEGENITNVDAGVEDPAPEPGSLSGRFFFDSDDDNQDNGEDGLEDVLVTLLDENGSPTGQTARTDANGNYSFAGLAAGVYGVVFTDPDLSLIHI